MPGRARLAALALFAVLVAPILLVTTTATPVHAGDRLEADRLPTPARDGSQTERSALAPPVSAQSKSSGDVESYSGYDASYIFGLTRAVARSTIVGPAKPPLFILTIPVDIVLLPFAVIGGFFS